MDSLTQSDSLQLRKAENFAEPKIQKTRSSRNKWQEVLASSVEILQEQVSNGLVEGITSTELHRITGETKWVCRKALLAGIEGYPGLPQLECVKGRGTKPDSYYIKGHTPKFNPVVVLQEQSEKAESIIEQKEDLQETQNHALPKGRKTTDVHEALAKAREDVKAARKRLEHLEALEAALTIAVTQVEALSELS